MVRIVAVQTFLHGTRRYEAGEAYDVDAVVAGYFVACGWAQSDEIAAVVGPAPQDVTLDIKSAAHATPTDEVVTHG